MASRAPTGWSTSRRAMHYKTVVPPKDDGLFLNLHKNVSKRLLPKGSRDDAENARIAKRILNRQRRIHENQRKSRWNNVDSTFDTKSLRPNYDSSVSTVHASTSHLLHKRQMYLPPVGRTTCITSDTSYSSDDIDRIVLRLTMYDVTRIPESKGYEKRTPLEKKRRKKLYSHADVTCIVDRLADFDHEKHPPESRGDSSAVRRIKEWKSQVGT